MYLHLIFVILVRCLERERELLCLLVGIQKKTDPINLQRHLRVRLC